MKTKYAITLCLCAALLLAPLSSCSDSPGSDTGTETSASPQEIITAGTETAADGEVTDGLPDNLNFGGSTVRILAVNERKSDVIKADEISASVENRQSSVAKRLNVKIENELSPDVTLTRAEFARRLETAAGSGDGAYDIVVQDRGTLGYCALQGLLADLSTLDYLDTGALWWPGNQKENSALNGKLYVIAGDASLSATQDECCIFVNAALAASAGYTDLTGLVNSSGWTVSKLMEMSSEARLPYNSDGSSKYFLTYDNASLYDAVFCGAGFTLIENSGGVSRVSEKLGSESFADLFDSWKNLLSDYSSQQMTAAAESGFTSGRALFHLGYISNLELMITSPSFAVVLMPMPLLDSSQENYRTSLWTLASAFAVTENSADRTAASAVLEALASYGYGKTRDAYYGTVFAGGNLNSSENLKTYGLLHDTLVTDPASVYCSDSTLRSSTRLVTDSRSVWSSIYQSNITAWTSLVDGLK